MKKSLTFLKYSLTDFENDRYFTKSNFRIRYKIFNKVSGNGIQWNLDSMYYLTNHFFESVDCLGPCIPTPQSFDVISGRGYTKEVKDSFGRSRTLIKANLKYKHGIQICPTSKLKGLNK